MIVTTKSPIVNQLRRRVR